MKTSLITDDSELAKKEFISNSLNNITFSKPVKITEYKIKSKNFIKAPVHYEVELLPEEIDNEKIKHYKFFQNKKCEFFPCHKEIDKENFNCLFCYCPLYNDDNCGGNYTILDNGLKDCSNCLIPHNKNKSWDYIIKKLYKGDTE